MKIKRECYGCKYFIPQRIGGSAPEGEVYPPECCLGYSVYSEQCNKQEYGQSK